MGKALNENGMGRASSASPGQSAMREAFAGGRRSPAAGFRSDTQLEPIRRKNDATLKTTLDQAVGCNELLAALLAHAKAPLSTYCIPSCLDLVRAVPFSILKTLPVSLRNLQLLRVLRVVVDI